MSKELFGSMNKQMTPSPQVRAALSEKLAQPVKKRPVPWRKYGAVAACAALVVTMCGAAVMSDQDKWNALVSRFMQDHPNAVYNGDNPHDSWFIVDPSGSNQPLHSYVTVDDLTGFVPENATTATGGSEEGDQDMGMTPVDLEQAMLDVGYTQEEIDEYQSIGYQMTWANWWKFVHQQENSEGADPFNLDSLKVFSQKELYVNTGALPAPNTGDLPGGTYIGDAPSQEEAVNAYEKLMDHFDGQYPDWYGGAYIDRSGWLVVQLVEDKDPADKSLELQVMDWTDDGHIMFSSCKYSLSYLRDLQDKVCDAMIELGLFSSCGADEERNRLDLTLTSVTDEALILLAELDPNDDAIYVQVGQRAVADVGAEDPVRHDIMPGGTPAPDDEDLIAEEPWVDDLDGTHYDIRDLPEEKKPAATDFAHEEDSSADTSAFTPACDPNADFTSPKE